MGGGNPIKAILKPIKKLIKGIVKVVKGVIGFIGDVVGFILNPFGTFDTPNLGSANADQIASGVTVTKSGTNVALPIVYGFRRVGGIITYAETASTKNQYLYAVYAICEGEIQGIKRILVDDTSLPLPTGAGGFYNHQGIVDVTEGKYKDRIKLQVFNGLETQSQSSLANEAGNWGNKSRTSPGVAYVVMRFYWKEIKTQEDSDNNPFGGGIPTVMFDLCGKKVYDIRNHNTGTPIIAYSGSPKGYSFNPASCLLDYMMNPRYGAGISHDLIDGDSFKVAANKFEQSITYNSEFTGRALTMNAVVDTNQKVLDNMKILLSGCRSLMPYSQGQYKLKVEDGGNATDITSSSINVAYDVDKNVVIGGITMDGERKKTKFNEVIVNFIDPDREFTNQQAVYNVSSDRTTDNNEDLRSEFTFHTITCKPMAWEFARMIYNKSRTQRTVSFNATQELLDVEIGDIIRVTDSVLALTNQTFRVVGLQLNPDLTVTVSAAEHDADNYPFTAGVGQVEIPPQLFRPDELNKRPRLNNTTLVPIGILPPNDPDNPTDSAGEPIVDSANQPAPVDPPPEENPLPPPPEFDGRVTDFHSVTDAVNSPVFTQGPNIPITDIDGTKLFLRNNTTKTNADIPNNIMAQLPAPRHFLEFSSTSGLCKVPDSLLKSNGYAQDWVQDPANPTTHPFTTSTGQQRFVSGNPIGGNHYYYLVNAEGIAKGRDRHLSLSINVNAPLDPSFYAIDITLYGDATSLHNQSLVRKYFNHPTFNVYFDTSQGLGGAAQELEWRWIKKTNSGEVIFKDGSDLGADYTYFSYRQNRNITGRGIEAYLNSLIADPISLVTPPGQTITGSVGDNTTTKHNLGA